MNRKLSIFKNHLPKPKWKLGKCKNPELYPNESGVACLVYMFYLIKDWTIKKFDHDEITSYRNYIIKELNKTERNNICKYHY